MADRSNRRTWPWAALVAAGSVLLVVAMCDRVGPPSPRPSPRPPIATAPAPGATARPVRPIGPAPVSPPAAGYLFCTWNAENLCDDQDDPKNHDATEDWFARDPGAARRKVALMADALLLQNDGRGPDVIGLVEVENRHAVELLQDELNARLSDADKYLYIVHRDDRTGRRIEPAFLSRLPAREYGREPGDALGPLSKRTADRSLDYGGRRLLAARIEAPGGGPPLIILEGHWTSKVTDTTGTKRRAYAEATYGLVQEIRRREGPGADVLLAGDFNDQPGDSSVVEGLRASGDHLAVAKSGDPPILLAMMAGRDPKVDGTYLYGRKWQILDHLLATPGLLAEPGWRVRPETARVANDPSLRGGSGRGPLRFGKETNKATRGPSDHFALTVRLRPPTPADGRGAPDGAAAD